MGYGVIGSPSGSGPGSLGSSPGTSAADPVASLARLAWRMTSTVTEPAVAASTSITNTRVSTAFFARFGAACLAMTAAYTAAPR